MGAEVCLLEDPDTDLIPHASPNEVLQVEGGPVQGIEIIELDGLPAGLQFTVTASMRPVRVAVTDATHTEGEDLLELDMDLSFGWVGEP
jgi:hypothetical protein